MTGDQRYGGAYEKFPKDPQAYHSDATEPALKFLFDAAVLHAEDRIGWYAQKGSRQARTAKRIRFWSLLLFALGTLAPILATVVGKLFNAKGFEAIASFPWAEIGYVLLALAGALVVFDQFFDASGSWIRVRRTEARLQVMLAEFRFAWAELLTKYGGLPAGQPQRAEIAALMRNFVTKVEVCAETETGEWAQRFSQRIENFDSNPNLRVSLGRDDKGRNGQTSHALHDGEFRSDAAPGAPGPRPPRPPRGPRGGGQKSQANGRAGGDDRNAIETGGAAGGGGAETDRGQAAGSVGGVPNGVSR